MTAPYAIEQATPTEWQVYNQPRVSHESVKPKLSEVFRETLRGKSLQRTLQNIAGRQLLDRPLTGRVLDLAAGRNPGNYRRFLAQASPQWISLDLNSGNRPNIQANMDGSLPFRDGAFDSVVFYNGIYIADEPANVLGEILRVLRPGGRLIVAAPTIFEQVPEPYDYWRFTGDGLEKLLAAAGFASLRIARMGGGRWATAAYVLTPFLRPMLVRAMVYGMGLWLDGLVDGFSARLNKNMRVIPIGFVALATKSEGG